MNDIDQIPFDFDPRMGMVVGIMVGLLENSGFSRTAQVCAQTAAAIRRASVSGDTKCI